MSDTAAAIRLGHAAISVRDPGRLGDFYQELVGLRIVRRTTSPLIGDSVLLSGDQAREDHELVLLTNPGARHIAFRVNALEQLRAIYERAKRQGLAIEYALDSGIALGFFVRDPEGNAIEIYLAASRPRRDKPPLSDPNEIDQLMLGARS
jgi:catechol-2,3-dioxygenase